MPSDLYVAAFFDTLECRHRYPVFRAYGDLTAGWEASKLADTPRWWVLRSVRRQDNGEVVWRATGCPAKRKGK